MKRHQLSMLLFAATLGMLSATSGFKYKISLINASNEDLSVKVKAKKGATAEITYGRQGRATALLNFKKDDAGKKFIEGMTNGKVKRPQFRFYYKPVDKEKYKGKNIKILQQVSNNNITVVTGPKLSLNGKIK